MKATWSEQLRREPAAAALAIFALSTVTILGAWFFQYVLKLQPCPLCLEERLPYHIVIPLSLLMAIAAFVRAPRALIVVGFVALVARPDRLLGPIDRFVGEGIAAQSAAVGPSRALRRGVVACSRHLPCRL
jgi:disulfide bond formation protein DsbB